MVECQSRLAILFLMFLSFAVEENVWSIVPAAAVLLISLMVGYDKDGDW